MKQDSRRGQDRLWRLLRGLRLKLQCLPCRVLPLLQSGRIHVNLVLASEFVNYEHFLTDKTLVFAISQSGETADVLDAVRAAQRRKSRVIGITNVMGSSLTSEGDELLMMNSGPEICVLSTKTYTSQVVLMSLLACALAGRRELHQKDQRPLPGHIQPHLQVHGCHLRNWQRSWWIRSTCT